MNIVLKADSTTVVLNGNIIDDFQEGETIVISPVNPVTSHTNGSNGDVIVKKRVDGDVHDITLNIIKFSKSDIYLNNAKYVSLIASFNADSFVSAVKVVEAVPTVAIAPEPLDSNNISPTNTPVVCAVNRVTIEVVPVVLEVIVILLSA